MTINQSTWDSFLETGKIDDYLEYCQNRKQVMYSSATTEGTEPTDAANHQWYRPTGLQIRRG